MQARSSVYDAASPKESDASGMTPMSAMGMGRARGFFKEQPTSTKNIGSMGISISTPKGDQSNKLGPITPKVSMPGLDLSKLKSIKETDEEGQESGR